MLGNIPSDSYSLIYLDPARRGKDGGRVYSLKDCEPDITVLRHELLRIAPRILLKASPMADIRPRPAVGTARGRRSAHCLPQQ